MSGYYHKNQSDLSSFGRCANCGETAVVNHYDLCETCEEERRMAGYL